MGKGSDFERETCKQLSRWWTNGKRDDIFWRSSQSGGRATTRRKKNKKTFGQYGDVAAVDPSGLPLLDVLTIELKRGYNRASIADLLDRGHCVGIQEWEKWHKQVYDDYLAAGSLTWCIIHRRRMRSALIYLPTFFFNVLSNQGCFDQLPLPLITARLPIRHKKSGDELVQNITIMLFDEFLQMVKPSDILTISKEN